MGRTGRTSLARQAARELPRDRIYILLDVSSAGGLSLVPSVEAERVRLCSLGCTISLLIEGNAESRRVVLGEGLAALLVLLFLVGLSCQRCGVQSAGGSAVRELQIRDSRWAQD